ncbi:MAG: response regulator transcription factor [bacterium]|nr:response regulator transcription factor [bacterium]
MKIKKAQGGRRGVFIIDDEAIVRAWFRAALADESDLYIRGEATRGSQGIGGELKALKSQIDLLILDLALPERTGLEILGEIREALPDAKILIYTQHRDPKFLRQCRSRIDGYMLKSEPVERLIEVMRDLLSGKEYYTPLIHGLHEPESLEFYPGALLIQKITPGQREILRGVYGGMTAAQIATDLGKSVRTVEVQIHRAYKRLGVNGKGEFIRLVSETGAEL